MEGRGVGPSIRTFLKKGWDGDALASKQGGFCGKPFDVGRGVRRGNVDLPIALDVAIDAVIRGAEARRPEEAAKAGQLLCTDDNGAVADHDREKARRLTDDCAERFSRAGPKMKDKKTKVMVAVEGAKAPTVISKKALDRQRGAGDCRTCGEKALSKAQRQLCGAASQKQGPLQRQSQAARLSGREEWKRSPENPINQQSRVTEEPTSEEEEEPVPLQERCISALPGAKIECPVRSCSGTHGNPSKLRAHFQQRRLKDTTKIEPEGRLPRCANCGALSPAVGAKHRATMTRREATERRQKQVAAKERERLEKDGQMLQR